MTATYFTYLAIKNKNLPLTQNLLNCLAERYNLHIKVIRLDNKMNSI